MGLSLLPQPAAILQSPSYPPQDLEQGGSIGDGPNLLEPKDPWTQQPPGVDAGCLKNYQYQLAACYAHALKMTQDERRKLVNACYDDFQDAVDAALEAIAEAERTLDAATVGIYQPASPLIMTLPVEHCYSGKYEIGDQVLIDFPNRAVGADRMGVWHSARVIGWADNTRKCETVIWLDYILLRISCRIYAKNSQGTFTNAIVVTDSHGSFYFDAICNCSAPEGGPAVIFDAEITSEYVKNDTENAFLFNDIPGIYSRTGSYSHGEGAQSCDNAMVFNYNTSPFISVINSHLTPCGAPCFGTIPGEGHFDRTNVPLANIDSLFTIPPTVPLHHISTGEEKSYARHSVDMVVSEYPWDIDDDDVDGLAAYNGTIDIVYLPG